MAARSRKPTSPTKFVVLDGPDGEHGDLWLRTMSLLRMEGHGDYTTENPWSWGLFGIGHWVSPESKAWADEFSGRPRAPSYEGHWEFMAAFIEAGWREMKIDLFEALIGMAGLPITVFTEKDWRFYWRMDPDEIGRNFLAASIMEA